MIGSEMDNTFVMKDNKIRPGESPGDMIAKVVAGLTASSSNTITVPFADGTIVAYLTFKVATVASGEVAITPASGETGAMIFGKALNLQM